jgi:hypothetical protein
VTFSSFILLSACRSDFARGDASPSISHMRRGLLVARVDHPQIVLAASLEDRVEMTARRLYAGNTPVFIPGNTPALS